MTRARWELSARWRGRISAVTTVGGSRGKVVSAELTWTSPNGKEVRTSSDVQECALCGERAIVALPPELVAIQPDDTTHVCMPAFGGCNHGFSSLPAKRA